SVELKAIFTPTGGPAIEDRAYLTVAQVDIDVDSDNDEGFAADFEADGDEGLIEQNPNLPGKYVQVNAEPMEFAGQSGRNFVPMILSLVGEVDMNVARIKFVYAGSALDGNGEVTDTGYLRLWTKNGTATRNAHSVAGGGDYIPVGNPEPAGPNDDPHLNAF